MLFSRIEHVRDITDLATSLNLKPFALVRKVCIGKEVTGGLEPCALRCPGGDGGGPAYASCRHLMTAAADL
jgi:hypothetical protein